MTPQEIVRYIHVRRLPLSGEKACQDGFELELKASGIAYEREVRLSPADIVDFLIGDVGIEFKIRGQRREIYRQCERYCGHERIKAIVLATNAAMGMPASINGRPIFVARLGMAWL